MVDNDLFIGFIMDKLGWSYAENRDYVKWAKEMVGHWSATGYFFNTKNGIWTYNIFDLLSQENQSYIYTDLYTKNKTKNKHEIYVYGTNGFVIYGWDYSRSDYEKVWEINFGFNRYVCAVGNTEDSWFSKGDLVKRAESIQFDKVENEDTTGEPVL